MVNLKPITRADLVSASRTLRGRIKLAERNEPWGLKDYQTALTAVEMLLKLTKKTD